jgi:hypothetical protein
MTANREGFGGLGTVVRGSRGFVYPAMRLAEAAAELRSRGFSISVADFIHAPLRARMGVGAAFRKSPWLVLVSPATLAFDLEWLARHLPKGNPLFLLGIGLTEAQEIRLRGETVAFSDAADGHAAARSFLGETSLSGGEEPPFANWELVPLGRKRRLPVFHARGCTLACNYCPYVYATKRQVMKRAVTRTLAEWDYQCARHRPRRVVFRDPTFGLNASDALELLSGLADRVHHSATPFEIETRGDLITPELAEALRRAGCVEVKLGIESDDPSWLQTTHRLQEGQDPEDYSERIRASVGHLSRAGIFVRGYTLAPGSSAPSQHAMLQVSEMVRKEFLDPRPRTHILQSIREFGHGDAVAFGCAGSLGPSRRDGA